MRNAPVQSVAWTAGLMAGLLFSSPAPVQAAPEPQTDRFRKISGIYPHLAVFGDGGECGIGALLPWAGRLWFLTYPPHDPWGGPDKLWVLDSNLVATARPESVGGTHASRMIHRESHQAILGPYFIDTNGVVRAVSAQRMPGRLTGAARHLADPAHKIYLATMEEGLYEVDVHSLAVTELYHDMNTPPGPGQRPANLPGAHGKGLNTSQGRLVYANNGAGGVLASWDGTNWTVVYRAKFTEVTGPGGLEGNAPEEDRLWALGWDNRSLMLAVLDGGRWHLWRLPKGSYTHDADHGWFTEWPRIRPIAPGQCLMHMHGLFYRFPKTFAANRTAGLTPLCTYLKMPVDYCMWNGQLVMGRDDASTTGGNPWAGQSHSALWFGQLSDLAQWGAPAGFGAVWLNDTVSADKPSDPFFVAGFSRRVLHLKHGSDAGVSFSLEYDPDGNGHWQRLTNLTVPAGGYRWLVLSPELRALWVRLVPSRAASGVTAFFHLSNSPRAADPGLFAGLADAAIAQPHSDGIVRPRTGDARTLQFAATVVKADGLPTLAYYEMDGTLRLRRVTNTIAETTLRTAFGLREPEFQVDAASVLCIEGTNRFRLPRTLPAFDRPFHSGWPRTIREVVTERRLLHVHGTFYELPYPASGGMRRIRPVATHRKHISDFASWRGLLVLAGVAAGTPESGHIVRSDDAQAALWLGEVDDLWRLGPPSGEGGPWKNTAVQAGQPSDPYLMLGYEPKLLVLSHQAATPVTFTVEVDVAADNTWSPYAQFTVAPDQTFQHVFPEGYSAHWVRLKTDTDAVVSATFFYGLAAQRRIPPQR
jgi:hypothetical protein